MRYQVRMTDGHSSVIEAIEFFPQGTGMIFYKDRMRAQEGRADQWGNPVMRMTRVATAFINNVQSIVEIPEEQPEIPVAATEGINFTHNPVPIGEAAAAMNRWYDEEVTPVDPDGINWTDAQMER